MENDDESSTCRACLTEADSFVDLEWEHETGLSFLEIFNLCTKDINATQDDELPQILCNTCTSNMSTAFEFMRLAKESDRILREKVTVEENSENSQDKKILKDEEEDDFYEDNWISEDHLEEDECENDADIDEDVAKQSDGKSISELNLEFEFESEQNSHSQILQSSQGSGEKATEKQLEGPFTCETCGNTYNTARGLRVHKKFGHNTIDPKKRNLCNICGKTCSSVAVLRSHLQQHKGEHQFSCKLCDKQYYSAQGLRMHMVAIHSDGSKEYECKICGQNFPSHNKLRSHKFMVHTEEKYACFFCPKKFKKRSQHTSHERIHTGERPFECQDCDAKFSKKQCLNAHKRTHTGEKPYECKICGKRFAQSTGLNTHMPLHTGKTVECPDCDQKFSRPSFLILHRRTHTGERPYACHICPKTYLQKSHLTVHLSRHFPEKKECEVCGKQYIDQTAFRYHMLEHSGKPRPYQCDECDASFFRKDRYKQHLKIHKKVIEDDESTKNIDDV